MESNRSKSRTNTGRGILAGMTLVEVVVTIFIMTIGMAGFSMLFIRSWNLNRFILETGVASATASRGVDGLVSDLRKIRQGDDGSYPVVSGDNFDLVAFIDVDNDGKTERVHYYLQNSLLKRGVTEPAATQPVTYPAGDQTTTTIARYIANTTDKPIFFYYNDNYPGDTVNNPLNTPIAIQDARLVKVRLIVNINPNRAPEETTIESFAEFRNLNQ
ncbi:MAG: prepilin-type N-terminal cleavage/methylation domain-containing protein [Candidatus Moranbacteria bacterium]|nr:prepilin-type N-terminal cleavage/methylation domain-containing protein [Candidatus Moranbacteria bacterium]